MRLLALATVVLTFAANLRIFGHQTLGPECDRPGEPLKLPQANTAVESGLTITRIRDGTSTTLMMATRYSTCDGATRGFVQCLR